MTEKETGLIMKYFVLKPTGTDEYARASRRAMFMYASSIERTNQALANDLRTWAHEEEEVVDTQAAQPPGD